MYGRIIEQNYGDHKNLLIPCPCCGSTSTIKLDAKQTRQFDEGMKKYEAGELTQNAFPFLNPDERELLISGICPKCWESM